MGPRCPKCTRPLAPPLVFDDEEKTPVRAVRPKDLFTLPKIQKILFSPEDHWKREAQRLEIEAFEARLAARVWKKAARFYRLRWRAALEAAQSIVNFFKK